MEGSPFKLSTRFAMSNFVTSPLFWLCELLELSLVIIVARKKYSRSVWGSVWLGRRDGGRIQAVSGDGVLLKIIYEHPQRNETE